MPALLRRAPSPSAPATIIRLSASPDERSIHRAGAAAATKAPPPRRGSRGGDLMFGAILALILLIACLTWEVLSDRQEVSHAAVRGSSQPAAAVMLR